MSDGGWKMAAIWLAGAALSGPLGIVLHELAHFGVAAGLGFPEAAMHSSHVTYARSQEFWTLLAGGERQAAADIYPLEQAGLVAIAGPVATLALSLVAALAIHARLATGFLEAMLAGLALMAGVRSFTGVYYIVQVRPDFPGARPFFDEINAARALDLPVDLFVWPSILVIVACWLLVVPRLRPALFVKLPAVLIGTVLGIAAWAMAGPLLVG